MKLRHNHVISESYSWLKYMNVYAPFDHTQYPNPNPTQVCLRRAERLHINPVHVQIAVAGDVDSGKSTLISVLAGERKVANFDPYRHLTHLLPVGPL